LRWLSFLNSDLHPAFKPIFKPRRFHPDNALAHAIADTARTHVHEYLERIDAHLHGRDWLVEQRSIADPYLFVMLRWAMKLKVDLTGLENLARFFARMSADAAVLAAIGEEEGRVTEASAA
jgi:glutathione S-transferase